MQQERQVRAAGGSGVLRVPRLVCRKELPNQPEAPTHCRLRLCRLDGRHCPRSLVLLLQRQARKERHPL